MPSRRRVRSNVWVTKRPNESKIVSRLNKDQGNIKLKIDIRGREKIRRFKTYNDRTDYINLLEAYRNTHGFKHMKIKKL